MPRQLDRGCALALLLLARVAAADPDLTPEIYGVQFAADQTVGAGDVAESCAGTTDGLLLLRFGVRFRNVGTDPLVIGDPGCPDCATNPGVTCQDPRFVCSPADGHMHPHFLDFARYELRDFQGRLLALGGKRNFCIRDNRCDDGITPTTTCTNQGLTPGCVDDYDPSLGCQYIDVTDVPSVTTRALRLRTTLDPDALLPDTNRSNNVAEVVIPGCGDGVLQDGEECDPGITTPGVCCDADCHLAPAGSCQPPNPCAPAGAPLSDGTACGPGIPPCVEDVCQTGACVTMETGAGCLIGGTCLASGTADPVDGCLVCDPARDREFWSPDVAPDAAGLRCQLERVAAAVVTMACGSRPAARLSAPIGHIRDLLDGQAATAGLAPRLGRRLARPIARLSRLSTMVGKRLHCPTAGLTAEVQVLTGQFQAFRHEPAN